jgi:UDP-glucuronate 4-epimerase
LKPERILVTGAAGFIGSTLTDRLLDEGRFVVGLDNFDPFYPEAQKRENLRGALDCERFQLVEADIRDDDALERVFEEGNFDAVVHLAALAGVRPSLERPARYVDVNVRGTAMLFEAALRHGRPHIVFASSSSVYGERADGPFHESDPVDDPVSPYAATKRAGELVARSFHHVSGLSVTCARIFTAYGPRQRPDLAVRKFAERLLAGLSLPIFGDGSSLRDYTYIDDLVAGLVRALDRSLGFEILNLASGRKVSILEVVKTLESELGAVAKIDWQPPQVGDVRRTWGDTSVARERIGYAPEVDFTQGVRRFAAWLRARR